MELELTPDPVPDEREAVATALRSLAAEALLGEGRSAWWRAGVLENVALDDREPAPRPRELPR